jgi:hypothetical protein
MPAMACHIAIAAARSAARSAALEAAGVEFLPENGGGPGVRLRKWNGLTA